MKHLYNHWYLFSVSLDYFEQPVSRVYWPLIPARDVSCFNTLCFAHTCVSQTEGKRC